MDRNLIRNFQLGPLGRGRPDLPRFFLLPGNFELLRFVSDVVMYASCHNLRQTSPRFALLQFQNQQSQGIWMTRVGRP